MTTGTQDMWTHKVYNRDVSSKNDYFVGKKLTFRTVFGIVICKYVYFYLIGPIVHKSENSRQLVSGNNLKVLSTKAQKGMTQIWHEHQFRNKKNANEHRVKSGRLNVKSMFLKSVSR